MKTQLPSSFLVSGILTFAFFFPPAFAPALHAEVFNVNHTMDAVDAFPGDGVCDSLPPDNLCTLRGAIQEANSFPGIDVIILPAGVFTLTLHGAGEDLSATGDLDVLEGISLSGDRFGGTIIQAGETPGGLGDRVFHVMAPSVSLRQVTLRNGSGDAAGIRVDGVSLRLVAVQVTGNQGKGISGSGSLTWVEGSLSNNTGNGLDYSSGSLNLSRFSVSGNGGTGIRMSGGNISLRDVSVSGNSGGGIVLDGGTLALSGVTLEENSTLGPGGGIRADSGAVTISNSLIRGNSAGETGGGIFQTGSLIISQTTLAGNSALEGGGIFQEGTLVLAGSTVESNTAQGSGGGIFQAGTLVVTGSTLSGNAAAVSGGGVSFGEFLGEGEFRISGSTVFNNQAGEGGGIHSASSNTVYMKNTVLAGNGAAAGPECRSTGAGTTISLGYNLVGNPEGCDWAAAAGDRIGSPAEPLDPLFGPLALNGGPTPTHLPRTGSPAIDSGNPTGCTDHNGNLLEIDQRGFNRHVDGGGGFPRCDIGAVEYDAPGITVTPVSGITTYESGGAGGYGEFEIFLESPPTSEVRVDFWSSDPTQGVPSPAFVLFDGTDWNQPRTIRVENRDDQVQDGPVLYVIHTDPAVSADPNYSGFDPADVEVTSVDDDTAGVRVTPTQGLVTSETGASASFTVVLLTRPTDNVMLVFSVSDETEGEVGPTSVSFTPDTWNVPKTITVTGVDDFTVDQEVAYEVITAPAVSPDPVYNGMDPADVSAVNLDNDSPGITLNPTTGLITTESGGTDIFTVVLHTRPAAPVRLAFESNDPGEGSVFPAELVFGDDNWNIPQPVTVAGVDDFLQGNPWDGDAAYRIITAPAESLDPFYHGINPPDVRVLNKDDDVRGITILPLTQLLTSEYGGTAKISLVLDYPPRSDVSLFLESSDKTEGIVEPQTVIFNPDNWNLPQIVQIIGVNDDIIDENIAYTVFIHPAVSDDPNYQGMDPEDLEVVNLDRENLSLPNSGDSLPGGGGCGFIQGGGPGGPSFPLFLAAGLSALFLQRFLKSLRYTPFFRKIRP